MITDTTAMDWMTITGFEREPMKQLASVMRNRLRLDSEKPRSGKWLQYEGNTWVAKSVFMGAAVVDNREHFLLRVSGEHAEDARSGLPAVASAIRSGLVRATRLDYQLTLPSVSQDAAHIEGLYNSALQALREQAKGANPYGANVTLINGGDGECTLYLGSRTSERYIRVYQKRAMDGRRYTRLEVECKGSVAGSLLAGLCESERNAKSSMDAVIGRAVGLFGSVVLLASHRQYVATVTLGSLPPAQRHETEESGTVDWLRRAVHPAVLRLSKSPDYRDVTLDVLLQMLRAFESGD